MDARANHASNETRQDALREADPGPQVGAMRPVRIVYAAVSIWLFGWLTGTFGLALALVAAVILVSPAFYAWRLTTAKRTARRREYGYLAVVTTLAVVVTSFLVVKWFETGMDRLAFFNRECRPFRRHISSMPECKEVKISYTHRKGGLVCLQGTVVTKRSHNRLVQTMEWMIRNGDSGYFDRVDYPGKPTSDGSHPAAEKRAEDEQGDAPRPR
jgi:hypothetical protein